jgi:hypothetical protein
LHGCLRGGAILFLIVHLFSGRRPEAVPLQDGRET